MKQSVCVKIKFFSAIQMCHNYQQNHPARSTPSLFKNQNLMDDYDLYDKQCRKLIVDKIKSFLIGCKIPFNVTRSVFFIDMIWSLNFVAVKYIQNQMLFAAPTWRHYSYQQLMTCKRRRQAVICHSKPQGLMNSKLRSACTLSTSQKQVATSWHLFHLSICKEAAMMVPFTLRRYQSS